MFHLRKVTETGAPKVIFSAMAFISLKSLIKLALKFQKLIQTELFQRRVRRYDEVWHSLCLSLIVCFSGYVL